MHLFSFIAKHDEMSGKLSDSWVGVISHRRLKATESSPPGSAKLRQMAGGTLNENQELSVDFMAQKMTS